MRGRMNAVWVLGVVGLLGCQRANDAPAAPASAAPSQTLTQFELRDIRDGVPSMVLKAREAVAYEDEQRTSVVQPEIVFYQGAKETSKLTAPTGKVLMKTHEVEVWGGVTVVTVDSATLTTERLRYDPVRRKIFSDDPVTLTRPGSVTRGAGLESDPELTRVKILKQTAVISGVKTP